MNVQDQSMPLSAVDNLNYDTTLRVPNKGKRTEAIVNINYPIV